MKNIYILFYGANATEKNKVHGGGSFTRWITLELKKSICLQRNDFKLYVIWQKKETPLTSEEKEIYFDPELEVIKTDTIDEIHFMNNDTLFIPIWETCNVNIKKIREQNSDLRILVMIHGMRNIDLLKYDPYQVYYHKWYRPVPGIQILSILSQLSRMIKETKSVKEACNFSDEILTVSNRSMQMINHYGKPKKICYFHQGSVIMKQNNVISDIYSEKYMLIVNANRNEKNAIRSLVAFCSYKNNNANDKLHFYVVGIDDDFINVLNYVPGIDNRIIRKFVTFFNYLSSNQLSDLFRQCYFLLYPSRSEGYGLPLLDAVKSEIPVVASRLTSIPEVLGSAAYYIDPYETDSIINGIAFMNNEINNRYYRKLVRQIKPLVDLRHQIDTSTLINRILGSQDA